LARALLLFNWQSNFSLSDQNHRKAEFTSAALKSLPVQRNDMIGVHYGYK
jgi:hypothetical protein